MNANEGDLIIYGRWYGEGYGEHTAYVRHQHSNGVVGLVYVDGDGRHFRHAKHADDVVEGQNYWRYKCSLDEIPEFSKERPLTGSTVWVNYIRNGQARPLKGIVVSMPASPTMVYPILRVVFYDTARNRDLRKTLIHGSMADPCENYWSDVEPIAQPCGE